MLDALIDDPRFKRLFVPVASGGFIILFLSLGSWQLDRAAEKNRTLAFFDRDAAVSQLAEVAQPEEYQNIEVSGHFETQRQFLVDSGLVEGRRGFYVVTAFLPVDEQSWLMVNRGWVPRSAPGETDADLSIASDGNGRSLRGRVGQLPRVGMRKGAAFAESTSWPKRGLYPTLDELSAQLEQPLLPFVLLLDPAESDGFVRRWQPAGSGPMMHYGYALQWFAMAVAVLGLLIWQIRKKRV
jgi:surfeit locus 1 family protein